MGPYWEKHFVSRSSWQVLKGDEKYYEPDPGEVQKPGLFHRKNFTLRVDIVTQSSQSIISSAYT